MHYINECPPLRQLYIPLCVCLNTPANSNKQATLKPRWNSSADKNLSFVNGRGLIIIHYKTRQKWNPKSLVYYNVFVSEEQTLHRD